MAPAETAYNATMVSPKSRRLRTIASVLLVIIGALTVYGMLVLMPSLRRNVEHYKHLQTEVHMASSAGGLQPVTGKHPSVSRAAKAVKVQVLFMYGYWSVTLLLIFGLVGAVWLDFREITRQYTEQRLRMVATAAAEALSAEKEANNNPGADD